MTEEHRGRQIGKYQILEEIGRGTVGSVYKGYEPDSAGLVAVKVLAPQFAADPDFVQLFLRQARAATQLQHPYIAVDLDAGQQNGDVWMGMEYLDGISLRQLIRLQGPILAGEVYAIVRQLADALDYIHRAGLIHGDVRSGNVVICPPGRALLTELGVIRNSWEGQVASSAISAAIAPEQITGSELGAWTDLYALGVLAYEMLAGRPPYASDTTAGLLSQIVHEPLPPIGPLRPDLPPEVQPMLERALAKDPLARYTTGAEFAAALAEALQLPQAARQESRPAEPVSAPAPPPAATASPSMRPIASAAPAPPGPSAEVASPTAAAPVLASVRPPDPHLPPPWESVPIRAAPAAQPGPAESRPAPKITRLPNASAAPSTPADRIARLRTVPDRPSTPPKAEARPAERRQFNWLWLLLGCEVLLLLGGIVLMVLLLTGVL
jgi:serine/threonine-protein kinase